MAATDFGVGTAANVSAAGIIGIFREIKRHVRYVIVHKENLKNFEEKMELLIAKRQSVQEEVDVAKRNLWKVKADVQLWCERVDKIIDEEGKKVKDLEDRAKAKCFIGLCPNIKSMYQLSRKAEEDVVVVDQLLQQGTFTDVAVRDVPVASISAAPKHYQAYDSRKKVFDQIVKALEDPTVSLIGVYGPGGMGKTTLVKEVSRQVKAADLFCPVVHVTVTPSPNIDEIQGQIAELLGLNFKEKNISNRASLLSKRLEEEKKMLIVLDDIWDELNLDEAGIRFGDQHKGCKILLTSRNRDVLTSKMDVKKTFPIGVLEEKEAWDLFKKMAENDFENSELQSVATEVAKRCAGLPLAIVTIAKALRNKEIYAWKDASRQLHRPSPKNFTKAVYSAIELSYNSLESEELKQTLLLSCLLGYNAPIEDLLRCAMGLHLFDDVNTVEDTRNRVLTMVSNLKASCLLLDGYRDDHLFMHDLVRDVTLEIASTDNRAFALRHVDVFEDWERLEKFEMICLSFASIEKLPHEEECPQLLPHEEESHEEESEEESHEEECPQLLPHELQCPRLTLFSVATIRFGSYVKMPTRFFEKIKNIKVLDLIQMDFSFSPSPITLPTSLRTLCLKRCRLGDMVSLGKLKNLEILDLSSSDIEMLPVEIGQLTKLRSLYLTHCWKLRKIPPGVLSSLSRLEEFCMYGDSVRWNRQGNARLDELKDLSFLTTLYIRIRDAEIVPKDLFSEKLQIYHIQMGALWFSWGEFEYSRTLQLEVNTSIDHLADGVNGLLKKTETLYLEGSVSVLEDELPLFGKEVELPRLEDLQLSNINFVGRIWHNQFSTFENLTNLKITNCDNLKYILSSFTAKSLAKLKSFEISECECLREIVFSEDIEENAKVTISFPQLSTLRMAYLRHFIGFCSESYNIAFPSLETLEIVNCPELNGFIYKSTTENDTQAVFDEKVTFPQLEELTLKGLKNCKKIWHDQFVGDLFLKLNNLSVWSCERLLTVFPFNMSKRLQNLMVLEVQDCGSLEEIFEPQFLNDDQFVGTTTQSTGDETPTNFEFPKLTFLCFERLPKLKSFYSKIHTTKWPSLKKMQLKGCDIVEIIFASQSLSSGELTNQQPLFWVNEVTFPELKELSLENFKNCKKIWHDQLVGDLFLKLNDLFVKNCEKLLNVFPFNMSERLQNLMILEVQNCYSLEEILEPKILDANGLHAVTASECLSFEESKNQPPLFWVNKRTHLWKGEDNLSPVFYELRSLEARDCGKVKNLVPSSVSFKNLTTLKIFGCHGFVNLIACSTAKSLVQLTRMSITDCELIEEIIASEGDEVKGNIVFTSLEYLELNGLPSLASFCFGKHNFEFPALKNVSVIECVQMKIFSQGDLSTPMLQGVQFNRSKGCWQGSLNTTIQWMFAKKVGCYSIKELAFSNSSKWMKRWKNPQIILSFKILQKLKVHDCSSLRFLFTLSIALDLPLLSEIEVNNCTMMEHIIVDEGSDEEVENKIVLLWLNSIILQSCADLASFYHGSKILNCILLETLEVINCPKMFAFASTFSTEQRTETINDGGNTSGLSIDIAFFNNMVEFFCLWRLRIEGLENCKKIWQDHLIDDSVSNLRYLEVRNCDKLLNVFPFNMSEGLQNLDWFRVRKCDSLVEIFESQAPNADELYAATATESIVFTNLEYFQLSCLPSLASFCLGKHNFEFPALKGVTVSECPKMKNFCQGNLSTPQLQKVISSADEDEDDEEDEYEDEDEDDEENEYEDEDEDEEDEYEDEDEDDEKDEDEDEKIWRWEGNLNTTIQRLYEEMNVQNHEED